MSRKRIDIHRKGAIIPGEYRHVISYNTTTMCDGWPVPSFGVNCELDRRVIIYDDGKVINIENGKHDDDGRCCIIGLLRISKVKFAEHGSTGKCTACGASFVYGEIWEHIPTGEHIHIGHICGNNYGLLQDRSAFELAAQRYQAARAVELTKVRNAETRKAFLAEHPGLEEALRTDHYIINDINRKFRQQYPTLTEKQVALVFKIHAEQNKPMTCDFCGGTHKLDDCPNRKPIETGRHKVEGIVLCIKERETNYGIVFKMLVLLNTGSKLWVTQPSLLYGENLKGKKISLTVTIKKSNDDQFFGFGSRPSSATIIE
jgi:hypothetical protein